MEHRWGLRRPVQQPVHVWTAGSVGSSGRLLNVSISGGFVETELPVIPLSRVRLQFKNNSDGRRKSIDAQVVRVEDRGLAVEWSEFAPAAIRDLMRSARIELLESPGGRVGRIERPARGN